MATSFFYSHYLNHLLNPSLKIYRGSLNDHDNHYSHHHANTMVLHTHRPVQVINPVRFYSNSRRTPSIDIEFTQKEPLQHIVDEPVPELVLDKEFLCDAFEKPIDFKDPVDQLAHFQELEKTGKNAEILANFQFLIHSGFQPSLEVYNITLKSIADRNVESLEEKLTNLLNVYSTMLNNNIKPDSITFNTLLSTLFKGSLSAYYELNNHNQGLQYFQVAKLLFDVCDRDALNFDQEFYQLVLTNCFVFGNPSESEEFQTEMRLRLKGSSIYFLYFMNRNLHNSSSFTRLFEEFKKSADTNVDLLKDQFVVYELYIKNLIHTGQLEKATSLLDQILNQTREYEMFPELSQGLISSYLETLSEYDLSKTHQYFLMFDSLPWLPDLKIASLLNIVKNGLRSKDYSNLNFFWNYAVIRNDFSEYKVDHQDWRNVFQNSVPLNLADEIIMESFNTDELNSLRLIKEVLIKKIPLSQETIYKVLEFCIETKQPQALITKLVIDQGYQQSNYNQYLSSIIDAVPSAIRTQLVKSNFFRLCCEKYNLMNDNFYGIYQNLVSTWNCEDESVVPKLQLYYRVIYDELNDLNNYYVQIPQELNDFKTQLSTRLNV